MPSRVAIVWVITCLIWSTVWLFIKIGVTDVPPVTFAAMRLVIGILVMVPITLSSKMPLPRAAADWNLIASTGEILLGLNRAIADGAIILASLWLAMAPGRKKRPH